MATKKRATIKRGHVPLDLATTTRKAVATNEQEKAVAFRKQFGIGGLILYMTLFSMCKEDPKGNLKVFVKPARLAREWGAGRRKDGRFHTQVRKWLERLRVPVNYWSMEKGGWVSDTPVCRVIFRYRKDVFGDTRKIVEELRPVMSFDVDPEEMGVRLERIGRSSLTGNSSSRLGAGFRFVGRTTTPTCMEVEEIHVQDAEGNMSRYRIRKLHGDDKGLFEQDADGNVPLDLHTGQPRRMEEIGIEITLNKEMFEDMKEKMILPRFLQVLYKHRRSLAGRLALLLATHDWRQGNFCYGVEALTRQLQIMDQKERRVVPQILKAFDALKGELFETYHVSDDQVFTVKAGDWRGSGTDWAPLRDLRSKQAGV